MTDRLKKIIHKDKEVLVLDYSDCKEDGMIELLLAARELIQRERKNVLVLSIFNKNNYASPKFMRTTEKEIKQVEHLILKNAITGISDVQRWLVRGINLWYRRQLHVFDSIDGALDFLAAD
jgi:hypothetical protein